MNNGSKRGFLFLTELYCFSFSLYYGFRPSWFGLRVVNLMVVWATVNDSVWSVLRLSASYCFQGLAPYQLSKFK